MAVLPASAASADHDTISERQRDSGTGPDGSRRCLPMAVRNRSHRARGSSRRRLSRRHRARTMPHSRFWLLTIGICLGLFLSMLDTSIVATSLYTIGEDLLSMKTINWVALAYTLSYLGCAVVFARLADVIGRRNALLTAYTLFLTFSILCGFAPDVVRLIAFRTGQGVGGSGLYSLTMVILPEICPRKYLQHIGGLIGFVIAAAGVLGPLLGGLLTKHASWRWIFWINGPILCISIVLVAGCWPRHAYPPKTPRRPWRELDFVGSTLLVGSAVLVVFAFQNAGESDLRDWRSIVFVVPLAAGVFCWLLLLLWEMVVERWMPMSVAPVLPLSLFRNRFYTSAALSTLLLGYPYLLLIFSFPIRAQVVSGKDPLMAGVMLLPMLGATAFGSMISGGVNTAKNFLFETMTVGACLMTLSCGLLMTITGPQDDAKALGFLSFAGLGFGLSTAAATILVTNEAPVEEHAPAQGILAQMRVLGGSLGISTSTILVQAKTRQFLSGPASPQILASLSRGLSHVPPEDLELVRLAYVLAFREGMMIATAVAGAAILTALTGYRCGPRRTKRETHATTEILQRT